MKKNTTKLIYNPHAGDKRKLINAKQTVTLEDIKNMLKQYQIPVDYAPTKYAGHATKLARESIKEKYDTVLVAGGDGTAGEAANGLVGSDVKLGIIPMGSFMNIARMLSIPTDIEKAILLIKINRCRKIDVGCVTKLDGEKLSEPYYFIETAGIGLDAEIQRHFKEFEKGNPIALLSIIKTLKNFYSNKIKIIHDDGELEDRVTLVNIANGPYTGAALELAPDAKLNDHLLTIAIYKMAKFDLAKYFFNLVVKGKTDKRKIQLIKTTKAKVISKRELLLHADASLFGTTPAEFKIIPNALQVICGFPESEEDSSLKSRTILDP